MVDEKFCQDCNQGLSCQQRHQQLAKFTGPSVTYQVIIAFLLPLLVLLGCVAIFGKLLANTAIAKQLQTALVFIFALSFAFGLILAIKLLGKYFRKNKQLWNYLKK
jgi:ABC-type polysaccharide/polyol phosphate export permease